MDGKDSAGRRPGGWDGDHDVCEATLPSAEALVAATLALMTGVVERAALSQPLNLHEQSQLMAAKVRANLFMLAHHEHLSDAFRATLGRLSGHWGRLAVNGRPGPCGCQAAPEPARSACDWLPTPERLQ